MAENILVVEYEPRYTDRVRQALSGQPLNVAFAKDGEEAIRAIDAQQPTLIVMTAVVPKISASELIRMIRARAGMQSTPILLTVSGYSGKNPQQDALKVGASDILPKPYTEADLLARVRQMLGIGGAAIAATPAPAPMTSAEIFGDLLADSGVAPAPVKKTKSENLDALLADTLSGLRVPKKPGTPTSPGTVPRPPSTPEAKSKSQADLEELLNHTLSGLEKTAKKVATSPGNVPVPPSAPQASAPSAPPRAPAAMPAAAGTPATPPVAVRPPVTPVAPAPRPAPPVAPPAAVTPAPVRPTVPAAPDTSFATAQVPAFESMPLSQPVFPPAVPEILREEEEEPTDGTKFGQYVLLDRIATGGMAEVWKARMRGVEGFQKTVAIKKILPHLSDNQDFIEMFIDEAKLAAQLSHNNIIHIYDLGKIQSSYYIAMEYVDGADLKTILGRAQERDQPLTVELALFVASKVASALDYAHRKRDFQDQEMGLVHRDVSPQNVLISQEGDIKLCDFGIAKAASKASHTQAGSLKGKLQYMSPEQAWGRPIDRRSDVFALAVVLFEMLAGRKLFKGDNEISILDQVRDGKVLMPSEFNDEVTPEIDAIMKKALAKDPADRYQTAGELARDLDATLYTYKPTPTSADLAIFMHRLSVPLPVAPVYPDPVEEAEPEIVPPVVAAKPAPAPVSAVAAAAGPMPTWDRSMGGSDPSIPAAPSMFTTEVSEKKKTPIVPIAIAAVVLLAIGGFFFMRSSGGSGSATAVSSTSTKVASTPAAGLPVGGAASDTTGTLVPAGGTMANTATTLDPKLVDLEVQKRLAAERLKLEQQAKTQQAAAQTATAVTTPRPAATASQAPVTATQAEAPPETRPVATPAPPPVQAAETPRQAEPEPAARAREGDLIPQGTEGLTPPRLLKRATVQYPNLARVQKVEGTVICSVLVNEAGQVTEVKVLRGSNRGAGLNEAAQQMMRRSTFTPGTKDGVRVKSWTTVPVDFKL